MYQYTDDELEQPHGLYLYDNGNVIVCGRSSHNVQVITAAGKKYKTLLSSKDDVDWPYCVSFRPIDRTFVVGCQGSDYLLVYKMS